MSLFQKVRFFTTVAQLRDAPLGSVAEVAFVGRSNAGKSSAINTLTNHNRLAFVSKTPGRTQHLNYFELCEGKFLVDLPGYGYAKAPDEVRRAWEGLLAPYLETRLSLKGVVIIMDCRHPLTVLDWQLIEWLLPMGRPLHVVLTKADKLSRQHQSEVLQQVEAALLARPGNHSVQLFSSLKKTGVELLEKTVGCWLGLDSEVSLPVLPVKRVLAPGEKRNPELAARLAARRAEKLEKRRQKLYAPVVGSGCD